MSDGRKRGLQSELLGIDPDGRYKGVALDRDRVTE